MLAGFAIFVAGSAGAAFLGARHTGGPSRGPGVVQVHYTTGPVSAGTSGSAALAEGRIRTKGADPASRPANSVTDPSQLSGKVAASNIPAGTIVTTDMFPDPQTHIGTVIIPPGKRALTLDLQPVAGVAGFVGTGDRIDVYAVAKGEGTPPGVRLVLQGIDVLNVNGTELVPAQGQPDGTNLIYLLAVTPADAERLIYLSEYESSTSTWCPRERAP